MCYLQKIDKKSIDSQLVSTLLTAVNWRNIFADDRHFGDYVTFIVLCTYLIMLFSNQYLRALYVIVNRRESYPSIYDNLFSKNIVFEKRFTIKTALLNTGLFVEKLNRMFLVGNKNYLNLLINLSSIKTLTVHLAIVLYLSS